MEVVRKFLSPDEIDPPNTRYNPDCDCVETRASLTSPWVQDDAADPRHGTRYLLPPREGENVKCDAAEAMMQHFKAQVDAFLASVSIIQFVNSVLTLAALFIPGLGILSKVIFVVASELVTIGTIVIDAAMTEEVYDQIKCILYDNIGDDGQMSAAQLADVQTAIDTQIGGTPNIVFDLFAGMWGEVGWSNAGAVGEYEGNCDDCGWCVSYDFTVGEHDFAAEVPGLGTWVSGEGWKTELFAESPGVYNATDFSIVRDFTGITITQVIAGVRNAIPGTFVGAPPDAWIILLNNAGITLDPESEPEGDFELSYDGSLALGILQVFTRMGYANVPGDPGGESTLSYITLRGTGTKPTGGEDC